MVFLPTGPGSLRTGIQLVTDVYVLAKADVVEHTDIRNFSWVAILPTTHNTFSALAIHVRIELLRGNSGASLFRASSARRSIMLPSNSDCV